MNHRPFPTYIVILCSLVPALSFGQGSRSWHEAHYFDSLDQSRSVLWGSLDYGVRSNTLTNQIMNEALFDGVITKEATDQLLTFDPSGRTRIQGGVTGELWYRQVRKSGPTFLFGFEIYDQVLGGMSTGLAQLYLNGNAPYEDVKLPLGETRVLYFSNQSIGFGLEWGNANSTFGTNLNLIKSSRFQQIQISNSSYLYTAPYGVQLDGSLGLDYRASSTEQEKAGAWYGTGASTDFYLILHPEGGKSTVTFQASNLGFVHYAGSRHYTLEKDSLFSGVEVENVLELGDAIANDGNLDSLDVLLGLQATNESTTALLPTSVQLDYTRRLGEKLSFALQLRQTFLLGLPQVRSGVALSVAPWLTMEPYVRLGGFTNVDLGLSATFNFSNRLHLIAKYELFESQIAPERSTGQGLFLAGLLRF